VPWQQDIADMFLADSRKRRKGYRYRFDCTISDRRRLAMVPAGSAPEYMHTDFEAGSDSASPRRAVSGRSIAMHSACPNRRADLTLLVVSSPQTTPADH